MKEKESNYLNLLNKSEVTIGSLKKELNDIK